MFNLITVDIKNNVTIDPQALTIKEFEDIWLLDKSSNKKDALSQLGIIYWYCNWTSIYYKSYPDETERLEIIKELYKLPKGYKLTKELQIGIKKYLELQELSIPALKDLTAARNALKKQRDFLNSFDPNERNSAGGLILKPQDVYSAIAKIADALKALSILEDKVKNELELQDTKIKGGGKQGSFENPDTLDYLK